MKDTINQIKELGAQNWVNKNPNKIKKIKQFVVQCATAYYEGKALITDAEFEYFVDVLKCVDPNDKLLTVPGWGYKVKNGSKHLYGKVGSLTYFFDHEELKRELQGLTNFIIAPKFDGINFVAYYKNGKLTKCLTRGNGYVGKNITWAFKNFVLSDSLNNKTFAINGEAILYDDVNQNINFRDTVAECLNGKKKDLSKIEFMPFMFLNTQINNYLDMVNQINKISRVQLQTKHFSKLPSHEELKKIFDEYSKEFQIDGVVITDINMNKQVAYKFN